MKTSKKTIITALLLGGILLCGGVMTGCSSGDNETVVNADKESNDIDSHETGNEKTKTERVEPEGDYIDWEYANGVLTIWGRGPMTDFDRSTYTNRPWEKYASEIKEVVIEEGVTTVGASSFYDCKSLEKVTFPKSITKIGFFAFYDCRTLESVTIPQNVTEIGPSAFYDCFALKNVNIPSGVTVLNDYTFYQCDALTSITIPESVAEIKTSVFKDCSSLTSITIENSEEAIDIARDAFPEDVTITYTK